MKSLKVFLLPFALLSFSFFMLSCNSSSSASEEAESTEEAAETVTEEAAEVATEAAEDAVDKTGKEYTSAYICPMHCKGSGSEEPGKCPVCNMDYEKNDKDGASEDHEGHDHGSHEGHNH